MGRYDCLVKEFGEEESEEERGVKRLKKCLVSIELEESDGDCVTRAWKKKRRRAAVLGLRRVCGLVTVYKRLWRQWRGMIVTILCDCCFGAGDVRMGVLVKAV